MKLLQLLGLSSLFFLAGMMSALGAEFPAHLVGAPNLNGDNSPENRIVGIKLASETTERPVTGETALETVSLVEVVPDAVQQGWGELHKDSGVSGKPLQIGDRKFARGLGAHAASELVYELDRPCERFEAWVGVDAAISYTKAASVIFKVLGDGRELFNSGVMRSNTPAKRVSVGLAGVGELKLVVTDAGDGNNSDHADWADPILVCKPEAAEADKPVKYTITSPTLTLGLTEDGDITSIKAGSFLQPVRGGIRLSGCQTEGKTTVHEHNDGGLLVLRKLTHPQGHACTLTQRFLATKDGIRWEAQIAGDGSYWTTGIITQLTCREPKGLRFWTAWSDPQHHGDVWRDPLAMIPLVDRSWHYGNAAQVAPVGGDFISIPLVTLASPNTDDAFSLVLSSEDVLLNMTLGVSASGRVRFSRMCHRLGGGNTLLFKADLVGHEADWRGGLRWMADRYPAFFNPPNPRVDAMAGCGAYSIDERPIDVAKFKKMAFRINWKLSDDFPYMGMFIPPVKTVDERWTRSCDEDETSPPGKPKTTSCRQMNDYAKWMRQHGFHVLSYFNVTEFGKNMKDRDVSKLRADDPALWKDPVAFLKLRMPSSYLKPPILTCYGAWIVDVGDPGYCRFMLEQAKRNIELLPDTDGLCIDRLDWLRYYNPAGDDGVSWVDGRPARSLYRSWIAFTDKLGPLMHDADKVIFANTMTMRLELNRQLDGIYTEHGNTPGALNAAALMGIRKPVLAWTCNETLNEPDPDSFFQRHLHLGVYPTAPYPFNNHCINPDPKADRQYMDYGPLLDAMRGKKWVLTARCVESANPNVKVNLFQTPGGYAMPVTFGGNIRSVTVRLRNIPKLDKLSGKALHPGNEAGVLVPTEFKAGVLELQVPLKRGCAMVVLTPT